VAPPPDSPLRPRVVSTGYGFPEGPSQGPDGRVYLVEMGARAIARFGADGVRERFADIDGSPAATAWGPDGALYVTNNGGLAMDDGAPAGKSDPNSGGSIDRVARDGSVERLYLECDGVPLDAPNDLVFDPGGGFYFTDPEHGNLFDEEPMPKGHVYWARHDGSEIRRAATGYDTSNGIVISADARTLLVAETLTAKVWAHDVLGPGRLGERRLFCQLPEGHLPDGMALDSAGHLIVAAVTAGALVHVSPDGEVLERIPTEDALVTNCCFVGPDRTTLVATEGRLGRVVALDWPRPGMVPFPERSI
jgi:gluconolactonase